MNANVTVPNHRQPPTQPLTGYTKLLSARQIASLSLGACRLYGFVWNRLDQKHATVISLPDSVAAERAFTTAQSLHFIHKELTDAGLLSITPQRVPKMTEETYRSIYTYLDNDDNARD